MTAYTCLLVLFSSFVHTDARASMQESTNALKQFLRDAATLDASHQVGYHVPAMDQHMFISLMKQASSTDSFGVATRNMITSQFLTVIELLRKQGPSPAMSQFMSSINNLTENTMKPFIIQGLNNLSLSVNSSYTSGYQQCDSLYQAAQGLNGPVVNTTQIFLSMIPGFMSCKSNESALQTAAKQSAGITADLANINNSACTAFGNLDLSGPSSCGIVYGENASSYALRMAKFFQQQNNNWTQIRQNCIQASANLAVQLLSNQTSSQAESAQKLTCDNLQDRMDAASCNVYSTSQGACTDYTSCYNQFTTTFRIQQQGYNDRVSGMQAQFSLVLQLQCSMNSLQSANISISNCTNQTLLNGIANRTLVLYYPPVPKTPLTCQLATGYAGTPTYAQNLYNVLPRNAPAKFCTASCCPTTTTTTASTTRTATTITLTTTTATTTTSKTTTTTTTLATYASCVEARSSGVTSSGMVDFNDGTRHYCDMTTDGGGWTLIARVNKDYDWMTDSSKPSEANLFHAVHQRMSIDLAAQSGIESGISTDPAKILAYKGTGSFELRFSFYDSEEGTVPVNDGVVLLTATAGSNIFVRSASGPRVDLSSLDFKFRKLVGAARWTGNRLCWVAQRSGYEGGLFFGTGGDCHLSNDYNEVQMKSHYASSCNDAWTCGGWYGGYRAGHAFLSANRLQVSHKKLAVWIRKKAPVLPTQSLVARYDASNNPSTNGWTDLSGNGYHLTATGSVAQSTTINGLATLDFSNGQRYTRSGVPLNSYDVTVVMVVTTTSGSWPTWANYMHHGNRDSDWSMEHMSNTNRLQFQSLNDNAGNQVQLDLNTHYIFVGTYASRVRSLTVYSISGARVGSSTATDASYTMSLGSKTLYVGSSDIGERSNAKFNEILYYSRAISTSEVAGLVSLLSTKWSPSTAATTATGWTLLASSSSGNAGAVSLSNKASSIQAAGGKLRMAWSTDSTPSNLNDFNTYEKVVEFTVPGTIGNRAAGGDRQCTSSTFVQVSVTCVKGSCNLPSTMYTGAGFGQICYGNAYGLVLNQNNPQCDWTMDGQPFKSLYLGGSGCHGIKDNAGTAVSGSSMKAIGIFTLAR